MATKSILIIGGSGFIGTHLALGLRENYKVYATYHKKPINIPGVTFFPGNLEIRNWVKRLVYIARPSAIIFAAGKNSVEWAEENPRLAEYIHTDGAATVASVSGISQAKFIYLSNCYTFDGNKGNFRESDIVLPSTAIGKAKIAGENFIRGRSLNYILVRSSPVFGRGNGLNLSFLDQLRMSLDKGTRIEFSDTELHSFAPVTGLIQLISHLVESGMKNKVLHYGGLTKLTYYDFARSFAKRFGFNPNLIQLKPKNYRKDGSVIETLQDYSLNSTLIAETLKVQPFLLEQGFDLIEKQLIRST